MLATDGLEAASFASGMSWSIRERKYIIIANKQLQYMNNIMYGGRLITHHILTIYYKITLNYLNKIQLVFFTCLHASQYESNCSPLSKC